jgi:hypothetical protein
MKINDIIMRNYEIERIISNYLEKLINELRFEEFLDITNAKNFIKSCKVFKNKQSFNCFEYKYGIFKSKNIIYYLTSTIIFENETNSSYENNVYFAGGLEKIELQLKGTGIMTALLGSCKLFILNSEIFSINKNTKTEIGFTSYSYKKLSTHKEKCLEGNNQNLKNYSYEKCFNDCFYRNLNQTYGCLPTVENIHLDFEMHFVSRGYRTCDKKINLTTELSMTQECDDICLPECESVYYNTMVLKKEFQDRKVGTFIEIFPLKFPHFIYTETLNMDFNQLIYNCGGILG